MKVKNSWTTYLEEELRKDYMLELDDFIKQARTTREVFPEESDVFRAFEETPIENVKIVIIGQDPYHAKGQAHGLAFSVASNVKIPPSLRNIYKELESDLGLSMTDSGNLISWARQGVLLLNTVLTVEESSAGSHRKKGWEQFTDRVIEILNDKKIGIVFLLWGAPAQKKASKVDRTKHLVLEAPHPSPLAAYRGFWGCRHFSKANDYLVAKGLDPIDWQL